MEIPQLPYLLGYTAFHLGPEAMPEDVEDTLYSFVAYQLDTIINRYDPARGRGFWNFLLLCLERYCHHQRRKLVRKRQAEQQLLKLGRTLEGEEEEFEILDLDPEHAPEQVLERGELMDSVRKCLQALEQKYLVVIVLKYLEEQSIAHIAHGLGLSESNVKVLLFRARRMLKVCLNKEGWIE